MSLPAVFELACGAQSYDWGKLGKDGSKVSHFAKGTPGFVYDAEKPYAELWMGTHPSCPSVLATGSKETLQQYLKERPELLGDNVVKKFGDDLPFLFKVLAIRKALSIQAHPDKELGARLHAEQPKNYKDGNHKPEMAVALTPFSGFCGFRPPKQIAGFVKQLKAFEEVLGEAGKEFATAFGGAEKSEEDKKKGLRSLFDALMNAKEDLVKKTVKALLAEVEADNSEESNLVRTLNKDFPGDVGIFCTYVLNIVHLQPGEAVFLKANEPHAYLDGDIMECMATSDNVVRAGLTPKLRDVPTLVNMLTYTSSPPSEQLLPPASYKQTKHTKLYDPPIDEFSVLLTELAAGEKEDFEPIEGPSILLFTELEKAATVASGGHSLKVGREGQVFFIGAGESVTISSEGGKVVAYRAYVEA